VLLAQYLGQPGQTPPSLHLICTQVSGSLLSPWALIQASPELRPAGLRHSHRNPGMMGPRAGGLPRGRWNGSSANLDQELGGSRG
jgi:hypothetical protein